MARIIIGKRTAHAPKVGVNENLGAATRIGFQRIAIKNGTTTIKVRGRNLTPKLIGDLTKMRDKLVKKGAIKGYPTLEKQLGVKKKQ